MVAGALAAAAVIAIVSNALFLQAGRHPSPMFGGSVVTLPPPAPVATFASPLPRPRPVEIATKPAEPVLPEPRPVEAKNADPKGADIRSADSKTADTKSGDPKTADPKYADPMTNLVVKSTSAPAVAPSNVLRPPAPIPTAVRSEPAQTPAARRIAAVQRALTQYGYGQLKPTGTIGSDTQAAISKFEHARKLPVTGHMSDRLVRELTAMIGHPVE